MTRISLVTIFALFWLVPPALAQKQEQPVVITTGEGIIKSAPDQAYVTVAAEARASNPRQAQRQNAEAMDRVHNQLKEARIPPDAVRTVQYEIQPEFDYRDGKSTLRGYLARNAIEVRVDQVDRIGDLLDRLVGSGATSVTGIRFDVKNRDALEREALKAAVADARARAEAAAAGARVSIDRVVKIEEQRMGYRPPVPMMMEMRADAAPPTPVAAGQIEVRATVTLTAELK